MKWGLLQLQAHGYDVLLCDLRMPDLDGIAFYEHLLLHYPAVSQRVIFLTGDTLSLESQAFLERSGRPWVHKPCTAAAIRSVIQELLQAVTPHSARVQENEDVPTSPHNGYRLAPSTPGNDPLTESIDEYQAFLKTLGYSPLAKAAYGKKVG